MTPKAKAHARAATVREAERTSTDPSPHLTMEERVQRIQALARRVNDYIQFMCQVASQDNTSAAVREKAVAAFHDQMVAVEKQLGRIHDVFQLE